MSKPLYDRIGVGYSHYRRPDPRIAALIMAALGPAQTILNVGAGAGSYEPVDRSVVAVEPSAEMVRQRAEGAAPVVRASAERLPFADSSFHAALAILTIHHWPEWKLGLREMQRIARDRIVILTWDPEHAGFWLVQDYFPEILAVDRQLVPSLDAIREEIGLLDVRPILIPGDCSDGFLGAYWRRPELYLDVGARRAISAFARLSELQSGLTRLRSDLEDGSWTSRYGSLQVRSELDIGYRLLIAPGAGAAA